MRLLGIDFEPVSSSENFGASIMAAGVLAFLLFRWHFKAWDTTPPQLFAYTLVTYCSVLVERSAFRFSEHDNAADLKKWAQFVLCFLIIAALALPLGLVLWMFF